ncbi:uncharacterized protein At1g65710 [Vicia villosa]|uniref:uncharacterized protein At1g65710 n=1 Tax=Vicia villosa TaxID=3911 RepID=UPI00273C6EDE|nr:uncharacterized protein At1g65710 [Vicia villosa]
MGACLSKKTKTSTSSPPHSTKPLSTPPIQQQNSHNNVTATLSKPENKNNNIVQEKQQDPEILKQHEEESQPKKEIFIIKHRKSHDEREKNSTKINDGLVSSSETESLNNNNINNNNNSNNKVGAVVVGVRTSSCTKEEVDAILIQCGRLSRSSSGKAASSSARKYSGSKRSFDFDHSDNNNDAISAEDEQKRTNPSDNSEEYDGGARHNNRQRHRSSPKGGRRRTPSREREREREREQRSSSRERRVSRSPGRRSSDANTANGSNNAGSGSGSGSRPGKMVTVPATVSSLVMDKSNNGGGGGGESVKRVNVKRNIASPRSMSPARVNGNGVNQNQQQPSLSRSNSARKTEVSPFRRNPLSEVDPNSLAYPQSNANNGGSKVQNKHKKEIEVETIQKPKAETRDNTRNRTSSRGTLEKGVITHTKEQQEDEIKVISDNAIVKNVVMPTGITRSRSSRRSRDFDNINPETLTNPPPSSYTSLLLEDIHNFHQKTITQPSVSLPACLNKACSILEAVADLNSTTSSTFSRSEYNAVPESSFVEESEVVVSDDVMEPSLHKYVTVKRGGSFSLCEDQESSGSNSFSLNSGQQQQHWNNCSSGDSPDCWSSRLSSKEESLMKRRECDHQHSGGIGRGRLATTSSS